MLLMKMVMAIMMMEIIINITIIINIVNIINITIIIIVIIITIPCKTAPQYDHAFQPLTKKTLPLQVDGTDDNLGKKRRLFCIQTSI